jgi:hypothetical protein
MDSMTEGKEQKDVVVFPETKASLPGTAFAF